MDSAGGGMSAAEMDEQRLQNVAYEYLCHLEEAKKWMEACIKEELPPTTELEEGLRNGVYLAKLAHFFAPALISLKKIYDLDQTRYKARGLQFRHTDNINHWLKAITHINLPVTFHPETTDLYDKKNMPKVIYCLHALSLFLFKLGLAPKIQDLYGKVNFTEEEISAVRLELEKYGIQMPAFGKIGGILASEMPVDEAALHAAIIAINKAIDGQHEGDLLHAMKNPAASLTNVESDAIILYLNDLKEAKDIKTRNSRNRSRGDDYVADVYDELLTKDEMQEHVERMNCQLALDRVMLAVGEGDEAALFRALSSPYLQMKDIKVLNLPHYIAMLRKRFETSKEANVALDRTVLDEIIEHVNESLDKEKKTLEALKRINDSLRHGTVADTLEALKSPCAEIRNVKDYAALLYYEEFSHIQREMQCDLTYNDIIGGVKILSAIADINKEITEDSNWDRLHSALTHPDAHISHVQSDCGEKYLESFLDVVESKVKRRAQCVMLTHFEIQNCVADVNQIVILERDRHDALEDINRAIKSANFETMIDALVNPFAGIKNLDANCASLYHDLIRDYWEKKSKEGHCDAEISTSEIQELVDVCNKLHKKAQRFCVALTTINTAVERENADELSEGLQNADARLLKPIPACIHIYQKLLSSWLKKHEGTDKPRVVLYETKYGMSYVWDVDCLEGMWYPKDKVDMDSACLNKKDIQNIMSSVNSEYDRQAMLKSVEPKIILLQAYTRGFLERRTFKNRMAFLNSQTAQAIMLQAWWRGVTERLRYKAKLDEFKEKTPAAIVIQSSVRMLLARRSFLRARERQKLETMAAIKIQRFWRCNQALRELHAIMNSDSPSFTIVKKFVHLLDLTNIDFSEELELHRLRGDVVQFIRQNQQLEKDLNDMDIKIGLLVKNRLTLQDVVAHGKKLDKKTRQNVFSAEGTNNEGNILSLNSLSKKHREKMQAYQRLFYLLQTNPVYLARLIFVMPHVKTTKFIESVIYSLYNFAANPREEFLLLKLFETALREEIRCRVDQVSDIITGTPMVLKMIVSFHRNRRGPTSLREFLGPLVQQVLQDKNLHINLNPAEVYKVWVNQVESQTGQPLGLKYEVTNDEALQHPEVQSRIQLAVEKLQEKTALFFDTILNSLDKIPYGMKYMAKVLKTNLEAKFPDVGGREILKAVGNLLYYRYINSAIAAPDAFDIVDIAADSGLTNEQRRNLGSIAKILQFAAAKKGFGEENPHLMCMNGYIKSCHKKFKYFFQSACEVEDLAKQFHMDEFSEAALLVKPTIYMTLQEILDTHVQLLEFQHEIAPEANDILHEMLEELGEKPNLEALDGEKSDVSLHPQFYKTEICLTLSNKFAMPDSNDNDLNRMHVKTKQMLVDAMRCLPAKSLKRLLQAHPTQEQREMYQAIAVKKKRPRQEHSSKAANRMSFLHGENEDNELVLDEVLETLKRNFQLLELAGYVSRKDHYQDILNAIAKDIRNQRRYRVRRKQELKQLKETYTNLQAKTNFYEEQIDYYNKYIEQCLANMSAVGKKGSTKKLKLRTALKYTAYKLYEKGVLLDIEDLPDAQLKNILFEIVPLELSGSFEVSAKFMGVGMEKATISIQNLLQHQYDGIAVMMIGKAKVNVNLLLFLLNTKFYGKS